jgi:hypothetical protein
VEGDHCPTAGEHDEACIEWEAPDIGDREFTE